MSIFSDHIRAARERDAGVDIRKVVSSTRDAPTGEIASLLEAERLRFLHDSLDNAAKAVRVERVDGYRVPAITPHMQHAAHGAAGERA